MLTLLWTSPKANFLLLFFFFFSSFFWNVSLKKFKQKIIDNNSGHTHTHTKKTVKNLKNLTYLWGVDRLISDVQQPLYDGRWKVAETNKFPKIFTWQFLPIFICCFVFQVGKKWFRKPAHACVLFCKRQLNEWHNFEVEHFIDEFKCWVWAKYHVPTPILTKTTIIFAPR